MLFGLCLGYVDEGNNNIAYLKYNVKYQTVFLRRKQPR